MHELENAVLLIHAKADVQVAEARLQLLADAQSLALGEKSQLNILRSGVVRAGDMNLA